MWRAETFRKTLVIIGMGLSSFSESYIFGHTVCLVAGLYLEKAKLQLTDDDISWITSLIFASMGLGTLLATLITEKLGRRFTVVIFNVLVVIYWLMLYYVQNKYVVMVARLLAGIGFGGALPMTFMATAECSSPKMRGFNLGIITTLMPALGSTLGASLGLALNWRIASLIGAGPALLSSIIPVFCVESPPWLASKGRFDECEAAFISLHGLKPSAQKELQLIIEVEKSKLCDSDKDTHTIKLFFKNLKIAARKNYFWKVMVLTNIITIYKMVTGKILYGAYSIIVIKKLTGQTNILPYMLAFSAISILGSVVTSLLLKKIPIRSLLFPSGILNNLILIGLSVCLYVNSDNYSTPVLVWTNILLYFSYFTVIQVVLFPILEALPCELFPLELRGIGNTILTFVGTGFSFVLLKIAPALFALIDVNGVFLINTAVMFLILLYLWIKLPETKGRTLHEIELDLKKEDILKKVGVTTPALSAEQTKGFIVTDKLNYES